MRPPGGSMSQRCVVGLLLAGLASVALGLACAGQERRRILTLLFDGVPEEDAAGRTDQAPAAEAGSTAASPRRRITLLDPASPKAQTVSSNHASFAGNCGACHAENVTVTDDRCRACHTERAHQSGIELPFSCGSCHAEHSGRQADLTRMGSDPCTECHDLAPFEEEHCEFPLLDDADSAREAKYAAGLEVFHSLHAEMEVAQGEREGEPLHCFDCHRLDPSRPQAFQPPTYQQTCSPCHELEVVHKSIPETGWGQVRGGLPPGVDPEQALLTDARWEALRAELQGRPELAALAEARQKMARAGLADCFRCHTFVDREIDGDHYAVVPPTRYRRPWFPSVRFKHSAHAFMDCQGCHVVPGDSSAELGRLMLPGLETCAGCHREQGASSACSTCHTFHTRVPTFTTDAQRQKRVFELLNLQPKS